MRFDDKAIMGGILALVVFELVLLVILALLGFPGG